MNPGATTLPRASISSAPEPATLPMAAIRPADTAMSPSKATPPRPSWIAPPRITRSKSGMRVLPGPGVPFNVLADAADVGAPGLFGGLGVTPKHRLADRLEIVGQASVHPRQMVLRAKHMHLQRGQD